MMIFGKVYTYRVRKICDSIVLVVACSFYDLNCVITAVAMDH
jgi:hypothetical protein